MNTIAIGAWEMDAPDDWRLQDNSPGLSYLEAQDGSKGCYIKAITFGQPRKDGAEAAAYVQEIHERSLSRAALGTWTVVERSTSQSGRAVRSVLDLLHKANSYRVLSIVLATAREAVQITLHDYDCEDYDESKQMLAPVAASLRGPKLGA